MSEPAADPVPAAGGERPPGLGIIRASWIGTAVFVITAVASAIAPDRFIAAGVATSMVLFFVGIAVFFWAYAVAVNRSRTDLIGMGGLFFLAGSAPRPVQISLLGSLGVQVVVGLATAAVHPFTPLAFGVLAWMYGLALCGLWAARYGTFPPRPAEEKRGRGTRKGRAGPKPEAAAGGSPSRGRTTPKKSAASSRSSSSSKSSKSSNSSPAGRAGRGSSSR